jgi:L-serine dehydratase
VKHSLFELFKIGIGPSSSHTMGPMRAALRFARELESTGLTSQTASIQVDLYGSLALTGHGHGTDRAILLGLSGQTPEGIDPAEIEAKLSAIRTAGILELPGHRAVAFNEAKHLIFHRDQMYPVGGIVSHPNGMRFSAFDSNGGLLLERIFFSVGGGFIVSAEEFAAAQGTQTTVDDQARGVPYPFHSAQELLERAAAGNITISQLMLGNECALVENGRRGDRVYPITAEEEVRRGVLRIWQVYAAWH